MLGENRVIKDHSKVGLEMTTVELAVNGTLMRGLNLNPNMLAVDATFGREAKTAPEYQLWTIADEHPAMQRVATGGVSVALEIWHVPLEGLGVVLQQEPPGLCIGKVKLEDGTFVLGVLGEAILCEDHKEISQYGGWRNYLAQKEY
jgi:hypothetical protein